ncbi:MAG: hypothetical protein RIR10_1913 [Planctomycetota bacterium]|jgi:hypothetical protein
MSDPLANSDATPAPRRAEIAERLVAQRALLLSRIRRRLDARGLEGVDADDIFSTTLRRVDVLASTGKLVDAISDDHLTALASAVAHNATREAARRTHRGANALRALAREHNDTRTSADGDPHHAHPESDPAQELAQLDEHAADRANSERLLATLDNADFEILGLRLRGADWPVVASTLGTTPAAAHRRYFRALKKLADLAADAGMSAERNADGNSSAAQNA